jgi:hypothetical protein
MVRNSFNYSVYILKILKMKNLLLFITALIPLMLQAQLYEWLPIQPLTDSSHFNRNACLYGQYTDNILFWDQELDSTTTQLCYKGLNSSAGDVTVALSQPGIRFTNPKILDLSMGSSSTAFLVFFQTNEGIDIDLKYFMYSDDGTITEPSVLSVLPGNDIHLTVGSDGVVAWENSGKIWLSLLNYQTNTFTEPYAVDSVGAFSPVFASNNYLNYLKPAGDSTITFSVHIFYNAGNWVINEQTTKSFAGACSAVSSSGPFWSGNVAMQNQVGTNPSGLILFDHWMNDIEYRNSQFYNYTQPAVADYMIAVKNNMYFLGYVSDSLSQNEIFAEVPVWTPEIVNISQWAGDDRNPNFFVTFPESYLIRVNLFWESEREGFSTIYGTHYDYLFGGATEVSKAEGLTVKPCPFGKETIIRFQSTGNNQVRIMDFQGREIKTLSAQKDSEGWFKTTWDGTNTNGNIVPAGCYVVMTRTGNSSQSIIIIKE